MANWILDVRFIDGEGRRVGGMMNVGCTQAEAAELAQKVREAQPTGDSFVIEASWLSISMQQDKSRTASP